MTKAVLALALVGMLAFACGGNALCDNKSLSVTCNYGATGAECVQFTGLSSNDFNTASAACVNNGGSPDAGSCPAGEVGSCNIPHTTANAAVTCSPNGVIVARYYPSAGAGFLGYTTDLAQQTCAQTPDAGFTPN
jgi:hypothetical protein